VTKRLTSTVARLGLSTIVVATTLFVTAGAAQASSPSSVNVPVSILGGQGAAKGAEPAIEVRVGNSGLIPVVLDTGSSGLHIFDNVVPTGTGSAVTVTSTPANITYAAGQKFTGVVATAVVTLGSQSTAAAIPFSYVTKVSCTASEPDCPGSGGISGFEQTGVDGVLGIGMQSSKGPVTSPILAMPTTLGQTWSLHLDGSAGALVLGASVPAKSDSVATFQLKSDGTSGAASLWKDSTLRLCTTLGSLYKCVPGVFDTGTAATQVSGAPLDEAPTTPGTEKVVAGLPFAVAVKGASTPFWTFTTGTARSLNLVTIRSGRGQYLNTGVEPFYAFTIIYDDATGTISLSQPS
jgi:Protein of unknown function (DUF3443)